MQLTKEQIQKVEKYLHNKYFDFIDLKVEVLDHIISDVEEKMRLEKVSFHQAFASSKQRWSSQLTETTSMFFGLGFSAPKIVIQKAKKVYWKQYVLLLASYFLPFLVLNNFDFKIENPNNYFFFPVLKIVVGFSLIAFFYMLLSKNNKIKTTYGFILKSQSLGILTGLIVFMIIVSRLKELNSIHISMICSSLFITISYFNFYKKHKEAIKKYKIS